MRYTTLPLAAALLAALTIPAHAMQTQAPLTISTCEVGAMEPVAPVDSGPVMDGRTVYLSFTNTGTTTVDRATFNISHGGNRYTIVDVGRFTPGALIEHRFFGYANDRAPSEDAAACTVETTHFSNGTRWSQ